MQESRPVVRALADGQIAGVALYYDLGVGLGSAKEVRVQKSWAGAGVVTAVYLNMVEGVVPATTDMLVG